MSYDLDKKLGFMNFSNPCMMRRMGVTMSKESI